MCWRGHTDRGRGELARVRKEIALQLDHLCRVDDVELIVGELLANIARYAPGPFCVEMHADVREVRLSMHDSGECFDVRYIRAIPIDALGEGGRGIAIIEAQGVRVEAVDEPGGCRVTAVFLADEPATDYEPTACPYDHPTCRQSLCPRVARSTA
jgi:anti-sigma regulatory factor (Ser/Thr protein kinase)